MLPAIYELTYFITVLGVRIKTLFVNSGYVKCYFKATLVSIFLITKEE